MTEEHDGREPGEPGDSNSANRCITYTKEWMTLDQLSKLKGMSKNGLLYRLKKLDAGGQIKCDGAGSQRKTLIKQELAEKVMKDGKPNLRAPKTAREVLAMPKEKRKELLKRNAKKFMDGVKSGELVEPSSAPMALDIDREKVKDAVTTLRDWVEKAQKALDILSKLI